MTSMVYKMSDVISLSDDFQEKFSVLTNLKSGEKLIIENSMLHKDSTSTYLQPFTRWWGNQGRNNIIDYIQSEIETYISFLNFVRGAHFSSKCAPREKTQLLHVYEENMTFINEIINGMQALKVTYESSIDIVTNFSFLIEKLTHIPKLN